MTEINYWLMKSEPDAYSIDTLKNDDITLWDGIRNYQARSFMRKRNKGDKIFSIIRTVNLQALWDLWKS